jgi:hypothetical protein
MSSVACLFHRNEITWWMSRRKKNKTGAPGFRPRAPLLCFALPYLTYGFKFPGTESVNATSPQPLPQQRRISQDQRAIFGVS